MDLTTVFGLIIGFVALFVGMILKGVTPDSLLNVAAILIIVFGTIASVVIAFPMNEIKRVPKLFGIIFKEKKLASDSDIIRMFSSWADVARREGLLSLEAKTDNIEDPFLKNGLGLAIDGQNADYIRDVLSEEVDAMEDRHAAGALIFSQAGTYAPTLGVLGAVVGLIAALKNLNDIDVLGTAISAAFVATLLGIFTGYVLWHPFANKLKRKSAEEVRQKMMMIEGILSVLEGEAPRVIEQKLSSYLSVEERRKLAAKNEESKKEASQFAEET
ncbi:flagellar motor stator protein MotA [Sporosarcina sp. FSL K6-2383]|uniref:flagellar motor stator protein MotA n=1 Tax=Sporosarcina sp. FSL K6-2383 TaxID=2921556 RepID=UPI00315A4458